MIHVTMKAKSVTIRQIAKAASVSPMTVSRVLRRYPYVSSQIRVKVEKVAQKLGYTLNPLVSAWMSHRRTTQSIRNHCVLGWICDLKHFNPSELHPHAQDLLRGAKSSAERHGYEIQPFCIHEPGMTMEKFNRMLFQRNITGLLISPLSVPQGRLDLNWSNHASVALGYSLVESKIHRVASHNYECMQLAIQNTSRLGYRRIALAMKSELDERQRCQWSAGFWSKERSTPTSKNILSFSVEEAKWERDLFCEWFKKYQPDAIIASAPEIIEWLAYLKKRVPEDVGYVHMSCLSDDSQYSGIYQNPQAIGSVAVDFLSGLVQRYEIGIPKLAQSLLVEGTWVPGKTVRPQAERVSRG